MFNIGSVTRRQRTGQVISFRDLLPGIIRRYNLQKPFTIAALANDWRGIAGDEVGFNSIPVKIDKDILFVRTSHSVFSNEISLLKNVILSKIKEKYSVKLKDLKITK